MAEEDTAGQNAEAQNAQAQNAVEPKKERKPRQPRPQVKEGQAQSSEGPESADAGNATAPQRKAPPRPKPIMPKINASVIPKENLLLNKYSFEGITVKDDSLVNYVSLNPKVYPNIYGKRKNFNFYNTRANVVERLVNKLMRGGTGKKIGGKVIRTKGRLQGKKLTVMHIVKESFDIINKQTGKNPIQVFIDALQNAAPIEDTTRVRYGGIIYNVAVDISATRRLNAALKNIALAAIITSFKNRKTIADTLAHEIMITANKDPTSYAIKKKIEAERIAKSAR